MATEPARRKPKLNRGTVLRTERLTPHMIRVVLGGDGLAEFDAGEFTDHYVKLQFPRPGVEYPEPFDMERVRAEFPREQWPVTRTYTVRAWDGEARELTIDFVHHGDKGFAGPWAANAKPGDELLFLGPGGAYAPGADAGWHLLAGDESALPAIAASLGRLPAGAPARVFLEVAGPEERQDLPGDVEVTWLYRGGERVGDLLVEAVQKLEWPDGEVHAFVHGEANFVKSLRRYLRVDRGVPMERLSISGYWRLGRDEDGWQSSKREWNQQVEEEEARALA
ncbi:NADPH-dependent ferric siderophore reductase [Actinomadura sp. CNU-125]|uniref:siderophore-interacting protein n=1 Tax=Actinomadura sp. CNU-125 TaxID=1904961 RepID=UPI000964921C|nr:siderophore-interacting protein [Actinomadura sp. CNU-125]OLT13602.1 NADPH-dependent ferric siderophore reductase [Actinomadura sp. CNU-125]